MSSLFQDWDVVRMLAHPRLHRPPANPSELATDQWRRLSRLLRHAHAHVPVIREAFNRVGATPEDIRSLADFERLPVFTRRDLQQASLRDRTADNLDPDQLLDRSTSGSTGERLAVRRTWFEERLLNALRWRAWRHYGLGTTDRLAIIDFRRARDARDNPLLHRLAASLGFCQQRVFDALGDSRLLEAVVEFKPRGIAGMSSAIAILADQCAERGVELPLQFIATGGELLTESLRRRIQQLRVPIFDLYGSNELNLIAWQCPAGFDAYHVCGDSHRIEILGPDNKPAAPGESGEVVATSLLSYAMPFIRYRVGDMAVQGPASCQCGAPCSTLLSIRGRTIDRFPLGPDLWLHPWEILNAIRPNFAWIRQLQLAQTQRRRLVLRLVPLRPPTATELEQITTSANRAVGTRARISIELTETISPSPSGKAIPFVALAPLDHPE